jgi:large subunit ribosomal protein L25
MQTKFELIAEARDEQGKGASRRLRHHGRIPAILYGGRSEPLALTLDHNKVQLALEHERFYSSIITIKIGEQPQTALLRDVQRHPWKNQIVHLDLQRVLDDEPVRLSIPLHFKGAEVSPGVKTEGGMVSHLRNEIEVTCLPKDLPEYIEVDLSAMHINTYLHLSQVTLPPGVSAVDLVQGRDPSIVSIHGQRAAEEPEAAAAPADAKAAPAGKAAPAKAAAKPDAKAAPAKK